MATSNIQFTVDDEKIIADEILKRIKDSKDFRFSRVGSQFSEGNIYMVEFASEEIPKYKSWFYAYVNQEGCKLLEDGEEAIVYMQNMLEGRRTFLQRIREFDLLDIVSALIAFMIVGSFVWITLTTRDAPNAISKEFLTIVSLVLGYYFGRNKTK